VRQRSKCDVLSHRLHRLLHQKAETRERGATCDGCAAAGTSAALPKHGASRLKLRVQRQASEDDVHCASGAVQLASSLS